MVVNVPRIVESIQGDQREMVRVQFSERDTRSYSRMEAEKLLAGGDFPDAFIVGDAPPTESDADDGVRMKAEGATFEEAAEGIKAKAGAKAQRAAPNKARQAKAPDPAAAAPGTDTKVDTPSGGQAAPAETKAE